MKKLMIGVAALSMIGFSACAQANATGELNRSEVELIVKEYLLENPGCTRN